MERRSGQPIGVQGRLCSAGDQFDELEMGEKRGGRW